MSTPPELPPEPPDLVSVEDLAEFPGGPFPEWAVAAACSTLRGECHWHIAPVIETLAEVSSSGGTVLSLRSLRVLAVEEVTDRAGGALSGWDWSPAGYLTRLAGWPAGPRAVRVRFHHGHAVAPPELVALVAALAAALRTVGEPGLRTLTREVGGVRTSRTWRDEEPAAAVVHAFAHVLARYRVDT